jgi:thiol:disulfide interchange protein DsbD
MILNLMPCVLPVVSLKVLSFVNLAKESRRAVIKHGALFTLGVMISFWALAACLLALQAYGHAVGWGFQLQEPFFVAVLAGLMLLFALSLFGVFELGTKAASWAGDKQVNHREGPWAPFFSGVLATAVATPCTGPFLGSAVGYAFTLSSFKALMIFTSLGFGMAFPYLLLSFFPAWLKFVPRPGAWMETFKQLMGFMMLLTVLWLTWVFSGQTSSFAVIVLLAAYFVIGVAAWIWGQWGTPASSGRVRKISFALALILIVFSGKMAYTASTLASTETEIIAANDWEPFSPERVQELRAKGVPVFIDFTAKWCLICQTNHLALSSQKVMDKMNAKGVVKMKADWTKNDPVITAELKKWGRSGVPLYLYYEKDDTPAVLPQVLTPDLIVDALD